MVERFDADLAGGKKGGDRGYVTQPIGTDL